MSTSFVNESKAVTVKSTDRYGDTYEGEFTFKIKLSTGDQFVRDQLFREYLGGGDPDKAQEDVRNLAFMLAQINVRVKSTPIIWTSKKNGLEASADFVEAVFWESIKPEKDYIASRTKKATEAQERLRNDRAADKRADEEAEAA